jgi:hypothetical protein
MKTWKIATAVVALALLTVGATFATVTAFGWWTRNPYYQQIGTPNTINTPQYLGPVSTTNTTTPTLYTPQLGQRGYFDGWVGMGFGGGCRGGRWGWETNTNQATTSITITQAVDIANTYVTSLNNENLEVTHIEEYANNFYVEVSDKSTGNGAFELLINKVTGVITPEMGPNMMWNTQYTFGNGWCNWVRGTTNAQPTVTQEQATVNAQQYLDNFLSGATTGDVTEFPGYYTIEVLTDGSPYGMLSVNAFTGQVWFHNWHGAFVQEQVVG